MAATIKKGDAVRFLNSVGSGIVSRVEGNMAYVEDEDGFETPVLMRELVVVDNSTAWDRAQARHAAATAPAPAAKAAPSAPTAQKQAPAPAPTPASPAPLEPVEEVEGGDTPSIVLAYEADNLKELSSTAYAAYLVNDSNYYLAFAYLGSADGTRWTLRASGTVEPSTQLLLEEFDREAIAGLEYVAVQAIAFKHGRPFAPVAPVDVRIHQDVTKFFKLHCYRSNVYFDAPVIAHDIVKNGIPAGAKPQPDVEKLVQSVSRPKAADRRKSRKPVVRNSEHRPGGDGVIVVDLHINELVDTLAGLSNADMLNLQVDEFRKVMDANLKHSGQKIVFIHGKGEGVLRNAIMKELNYRYKGKTEVQDASFREYGFGATQVTIR